MHFGFTSYSVFPTLLKEGGRKGAAQIWARGLAGSSTPDLAGFLCPCHSAHILHVWSPLHMHQVSLSHTGSSEQHVWSGQSLTSLHLVS